MNIEQYYTADDIFSMAEIEEFIQHYGVSIDDGAPGRGSGRYPKGSGENPFQHDTGDLLDRIEKLQKEGMTDAQIAAELGILGKSGNPSSGRVRAMKDILKAQRRSAEFAIATQLREEGLSYQAIAEKMGYKNDSSIRNLLREDTMNRRSVAMNTAEYLKGEVDKYGMVDVGKGAERYLNVSQTKLKAALEILEEQGYHVYGGGIPQVTNPGKQSNQSVLCVPGTAHKDIYQFDKIHSLADSTDILTEDGTKVRPAFVYPQSIDGKRIFVRYGDQGGSAKDGVIELRRGVKDLDLGDSHYAQVRVLVDGTHYIKGMALYSDDIPDGYDILINSNKATGTPLTSPNKKDKQVLKPISSDPDNPFGALLRMSGGQTYYDDPNGNYIDPETGKKQSLNAINKTRQEGDWNEWADKLPSQFLSKQPRALAKRQLDMAYADRMQEFKDIMELTNPTVKKKLLYSFADSCDSDAVHLKAASLPRQKYQVILPLTSIKDNEVYAPNYTDGEQVALIRYPHGGTFEIPILTVNNKQKEGIRVLGKNPKDAIGINVNVAERLSGADFDGDTVMVIPCNNGHTKIISTPALEGLKGFDPKMAYPKREGMKEMKNTQTEMGKISNLITDMTIKGAREDELARAVRHSMVVIDAEKHHLDYKRSEIDNDIASLRKMYQQKDNGRAGGASTIISRASGEYDIPKRQGSAKIDPETGEKIWKTADDNKLYYTKTITNKKGEEKEITKMRYEKSTQMAEHKNAFDLVSDADSPMERVYANYANQMKSLGNTARKEMLRAGRIEYNSTANKAYKEEVNSLLSKLNEAEKNRVRERDAQRIANTRVAATKQTYIEAGLTKEEIKKEMKKANQRELVSARVRTGAKRTTIDITDREWEAIQSGAISENRLTQILDHVDTDVIKERATPRAKNELSAWKQSKIKAMAAQGYTNEQIAKSLGCSSSTVSKYL